MRGCGCLIGMLLIPVAVVMLMVFVVLPSVMDIKSIPPLNNLLQTVLCEKGEILDTEQHVGPSDEGGTSYSATYSCMNSREVERDVTGRAVMLGIATFVVPLLVGLFLIIGTSVGMAGRAATNAIGSDPSAIFTIGGSRQVSAFGMPSQKGSVSDRLKALKNAYDQGLITESEYETKRQEILGEM
jgi:hypothetical protein